jgi:hypothetical protein
MVSSVLIVMAKRGLALFWHESVFMDIKDTEPRYIDAHGRLRTGGPLFHVAFMYGDPKCATVIG